RAGKPAEAILQAAVFDREKDLPGPAAVNVARLYAVAATSSQKDTSMPEPMRAAMVQQCVGRGAEWLDLARTSGTFKDAAARKRLQEDNEMEPLRNTDAYRRAIDKSKE